MPSREATELVSQISMCFQSANKSLCVPRCPNSVITEIIPESPAHDKSGTIAERSGRWTVFKLM